MTLANATAVPTIPAADLVPRNATSETVELSIATGIFDIKPNPYGPPCGMTWDSIISVNSAGDQSKASPLCKFLYQYITLPTSQGKGDKQVNFIYLCPPQWPEPTLGYGSLNIKFIVTGPTMFPGDHATVPVNLQILNINTIPPTNVKIPVEIGYYFDTNNPVKPGFKMLTLQNIRFAAT
jgi:hypothetical protein